MTASIRFNILKIGLALTFIANSVKAFLIPGEIYHLVEHSPIFGLIYEKVPAFSQLVGFHDLMIGLLLMFSFKQLLKLTVAWAAFWIIIVIMVLLSHQSSHESLEALEHAAPLALAFYLSLTLFYTKETGVGRYK